MSTMPDHKRGLILISFCALLWSSGGLFIKVLKLDAFQISFYRSLIAAITILIITTAKGKSLKFDTDKISFLCSISYAFILVLFVMATKLTTAANAIFLQFTAPIYLLLIEPIFLKTKFEKRNLIALIFCFIGMTLFFFGKLDFSSIQGNILAICSGICFALFSLFLKWKKQLHKSESTIANIIVGNFLVCVICLPFIYDKLIVDLSQLVILLFMGVFQIGISYMIFNEGIKYVSATESMIIAMLEAILNPIWVFIGVGEVPTVYSIIGSVIILFAVLWRTLMVRPEEKLEIVD
jgi:drug/metabolite transporter (DMT)-like permease